MIGEVILLNLEFIIVCILGPLAAILIIILCVLIICKLKRRSPEHNKELETENETDEGDEEKEVEPLLKKRKLTTTASNLSSGQTAFHFKNNAFILKNRDDSTITFSVSFREETEKIALRIKEITIGGKTVCIRPHLPELGQIYFRIMLNNNTSNSTIMSEMYKFRSKLTVEENFLFSIKKTQLKGTSAVIEVFITLYNKTLDLLLGWVEIGLPYDMTQYPLEDNPILKEYTRLIDLYVKPMGYVCIILTSLHDKIKLALFATNFRLELLQDTERKESVVFFTLQIKNQKDFNFGLTCKTTMKVPLTTIGWNEVFNFDVPNSMKHNSYITIEFLRSYGKLGSQLEPPKIMGSLDLGLTDQCPEKSQAHWKFILENEDIEFSKWHPIRAVE